MNKNELIARVAQISGLPKADAARAVDAYVEAVSSTVATGDEVRILGFGTYYSREREASEGRNPRTGEVIRIPRSRQPKFKPGKAFKDACNPSNAKKKAA